MGLTSPTKPFLLFAAFKAEGKTTSTFTLLPSVAVQGGGFDVDKQKCPPDGGSSDCVTGSPASSFPSSIPSSYLRSTPVCIPRSNKQAQPLRHIATPPLSPDVGSDASSTPSSLSSVCSIGFVPSPPEFFTNLFPRSGHRAAEFAKGVAVSEVGATFEGFVLDLPKGNGVSKMHVPRTLYVNGTGAENVPLRESIVAMLELADEHLECEAFVIALDKSSPALGDIIHSLLYVGGTVVTKPPFEVDPNYVLVGIEI